MVRTSFCFYNSLMIEDTHKIVNWLKMKLEISLTTTQRKTTLSDNLYWKIMVSAVLWTARKNYMYNVNTLSKPLLCIIQAQLTKTNKFLFFTKTSLPNHETTKYCKGLKLQHLHFTVILDFLCTESKYLTDAFSK